MSRYLIGSHDKAFTHREEFFSERGLFDFWSLSMSYIKTKFPPHIDIGNIDDAFNILKTFVSECGNTICMDSCDLNYADHINGVEVDNSTMKLILYSADEAYKKAKGEILTESIIEMGKQIYGENMELQYAFTFNFLTLTPSYILLYAKRRDIPAEIDNDTEMIKIDKVIKDSKIYDHIWGDYSHEPILQFHTRYFCDEKLVAVLYPKGSRNSFHADDFFNMKV